jgi:hypothetical protein
MTQPAFSRVAWIAPCMTKPAAFGSYPPLSPIGGGEVAPHRDLGRAAFPGLGQAVRVQPEVRVDGGLAHAVLLR